MNPAFLSELSQTVANALREDIGPGDVTAALVDSQEEAEASVVTREVAVIAGRPWVDEVFHQIDPMLSLDWRVAEGEVAQLDQVIVQLRGKATSILTGERTALNFLQTLSATATAAHRYASLLASFKTQLLDTRKTLPGLRLAQKYAVHVGGGTNHRIGLFDAYLIKENHIAAAGGISRAIQKARSLNPDLRLEVEVESLSELEEAIQAAPDWIMLDNFDDASLKSAVAMTPESIKLEVSGGIDSDEDILRIAALGVDFISIGAITKHIRATDLSLRLNLNESAKFRKTQL